MRTHPRGQVIRLYTDPPFRDDNGVETDPTTVVVRVTSPDAVTTDYTGVKTTSGQGVTRSKAYANGDYYYDLATAGLADSKLGIWIYTWIGTGTVAAADKATFRLEAEDED